MKDLKLSFKAVYRPNPRLERQLMERAYTPLSKMGAYARKTAMNSLKSRKGGTEERRQTKTVCRRDPAALSLLFRVEKIPSDQKAYRF